MPQSCTGCNLALSIRIASPGDDGNVTQANTFVAQASTVVVAPPAPPAPPPLFPPVVEPAAWIPPPAGPTLFAPSPTAPQRELAWSPLGGVAAPVVPVVVPPLTQFLPPPRAGPGPLAGHVPVHAHVQRRRVVRHTRGSTSVVVTATASTSIVLVQRAIVRATRTHSTRAAAHAPRTAATPEHRPPRPPLAPSGPGGPASAGTAGASAHGGGASVLTVAAVAALALVAIALLSSFVPASLPVRRRLSDDRQARPG